VRAQAGPGESAPSNTDRGWRSVAPPASVSATDGTEREFVRVTWTASSSPAVTGYRVLRQLPGGQLTQLDAVPAPASSLNDKTIAPGIVGRYVVRCITARGDSPAGTSDTGFRPADGGTSSDGADDSSGTGGGIGDSADHDRGGATTHRRPSGSGMTAAQDRSGSQSSTSEQIRDGHGQTPLGSPATPADGAGTRDAECDTPASELDCGEPAVGSQPVPPTCDEIVARVRGMAPDSHAQPTCDMLLSGDVPAACRMAAGDVNLDGRVDDRDMGTFLIAWADRDLLRGDLNRDGQVDVHDLALALRSVRKR